MLGIIQSLAPSAKLLKCSTLAFLREVCPHHNVNIHAPSLDSAYTQYNSVQFGNLMFVYCYSQRQS